MTEIKIHNADVIEWLKNYAGEKFHAVISDPPYGLAFMGKSWDKYTPIQYQTWCSAGLEDAGFEIFDSMVWITGQGFPKSHNLIKHGASENWNGYGTALKPAFETIVICRKPRGKETFIDCALNYGTGSLNVDGGRIKTHDNTKRKNIVQMFSGIKNNIVTNGYETGSDLGRFPANLGLICDCECEPCECDYQTIGDSARFFYTAKSSRKERNLGLDHLPDSYIATMGDGIGEREHNENEPNAYVKNNHPTVKPIKLIEYLTTMLKPPIENSSILIPFSGSGSEIIGSMFAGWNIINAIEIDAGYCNIAENRIRYWQQFNTYADGLKGKKE